LNLIYKNRLNQYKSFILHEISQSLFWMVKTKQILTKLIFCFGLVGNKKETLKTTENIKNWSYFNSRKLKLLLKKVDKYCIMN